MSSPPDPFPRQLVIPCQEHDAVSVPFAALLGPDGKLDLYDEVARSGYFDIDFRRGDLVVKATRFVGFIPLSDRVAIHVTPKAPIANLLYMVSRADVQTKGLSDFVRGYADELNHTAYDIEDVYANSFVSALINLRRTGVLRRYVSRETDQQFRGRLLLTKSIARRYAHNNNRHPFFVFSEHTVDIEENRLLKSTATRLKNHFLSRGGAKNVVIARQFQDIQKIMSAVSDIGELTPSSVRSIPQLLRALPTSHRFYEPALWLAYLIASGRSVRMEALGRARFETLILDVSAVFEEYVRALLLTARRTVLAHLEVLDGNLSPVPLFTTGLRHTTHPDYYFRSQGVLLAMADAKYKSEPSTQDRYEILAFCEALGVQRAAIICPLVNPGPRVSHHGTTRAGRRISIVRIDLAAKNMQSEETAFVLALTNELNLVGPTGEHADG
jgi:5-methylcytosine-specific restriction enzyme subunit McrC